MLRAVGRGRERLPLTRLCEFSLEIINIKSLSLTTRETVFTNIAIPCIFIDLRNR
jgi:hypothetical protein